MRRLDLKKETLVQLSTDELGDVVGGTMPTKFNCTETHQVCVSLEGTCWEIIWPTRSCIPTQTC